MLEEEKAPIVYEIQRPSLFLKWDTPLRGEELLRLSVASLDDVARFYAGKPKEEKEPILLRVRFALSNHVRPYMKSLIKVSDRSGRILAWAVVGKNINAPNIFEEERGKRDRMVVQEFDVAEGSQGVSRGFVPLLLFVGHGIELTNQKIVWDNSSLEAWFREEINQTTPHVQIQIPFDKKHLIGKIPFQMAVPEGTFPGEDFLDEDEGISGRERELPQEIFFDAEKLLAQQVERFVSFNGEANFFQMVRHSVADPARFSKKTGRHNGWYFVDHEVWTHSYGNQRPVAESHPILDLAKTTDRKRKSEVTRFFVDERTTQGMLHFENKTWIVEKEGTQLLQLPIAEEQDVYSIWGALEAVMSRHGVSSVPNEIFSYARESFLKEALNKLEDSRIRGLSEEAYFKQLSWLTGSRIRVLDRSAEPEWIVYEYKPWRLEGISDEGAAAYEMIFCTKQIP